MLDRIRSLGRRVLRASLLATLAASAWSAAEQSAWAQLRTGQSDRPLYYGQMNNGTARPKSSQDNRTSGSQMTRSGTRARVVSDRPARSIMEADGQGQEPVAPKQEAVPPKADGMQAAPRPAPAPLRAEPEPLPYDDTANVIDDYQVYDDGPSHHGGCSCGRCGQSSYFADLAPGCFSGSCGIGMCDGPLQRFLGSVSVRGEVPLYWRRSIGLPLLVTSANSNAVPINLAGRSDQNTTVPVYGNGFATEDLQAGVRITVSGWLDPTGYRGVIFRYANTGDQNTDFNANSNTNPILVRPFNRISTGAATPDTQLISYPGSASGSVHVGTTSAVDGFDVVMKRLAYRDRFTRVDWLMGYQHNRIDESVRIDSRTTDLTNAPPLNGATIAITDQIRTTNTFNGAVIGLMSSRQFAYWKFEAMGRLGMGSLQRDVTFAGATTTTTRAGDVTTDSQGLLVRNTNNQRRKDDTFVVAPEIGFNAGYWLTQNLDFTIGYNYLMIGKVAQPGRQFDNTANLTAPLNGALRPGFVLDTQRYWVHSLNLGMQWRY